MKRERHTRLLGCSDLGRLAVAAALVLAGLEPSALRSAEDQPAGEWYAPSLLQGLDYRMVGPHRGGRVTAVAGVIQQRSTFYMGATGGGVWKTTDYGATWLNVTDGFLDTGSIGALDVADSDPNVVYVGTGSACIRSNIITGRGVWRSADAGDTWTFLGLRDAGQIGDLVVHPRNPELVYVAALGHPFGSNTERGVFRSRDGGASWENVLFVSERTGAVDLAIDPSNPRRIFAAMWTAERKPWTILSGSEESGLYLTTNGGDTWTKLGEKLGVGLPTGLVGKIAVEVSPADPKRVYALVEAPGEARGLYRSDDGGKSFRFVNGQLSLTYRPFYYMHLAADPRDPDKLYVHNETLWVTQDGGRTFASLATPHGDNHAHWIHPDDPDLMVQGNDGGANVSQDGGRTWSPQWNQPTAELYQVEVDTRFPYRLYGAQQDNTTISVPSRISRVPIDPKEDWYEVSGCETGPIEVHPDDPNIVYGGCKGRHSVYDHRTGQTQEYWVYPHFNYGHDTRDMPYRFQRTAPMILSPHDPAVIYHGSHVLHRSTDGGKSWETISPDLTAFDPEQQGYSGGPITRDITGEEIAAAIYTIAESPLRHGELWVGANDGPIHVSLDGGGEWSDVTPKDLPPGGRVNSIEPSRFVAGRAYVAVYRFQLDDWVPYVYRADDHGANWTRLTDGHNGIPADTPVRVVREDPDREGLLYAGTEFGMYVSFDGGTRWQPLQLDLPVSPVTDIEVWQQDLVLSTMGRSFWVLDDLTPLHQLTAAVRDAERHLFAPRPAHRARWVGSLERRFPGFAPEYPPMGAAIHYHLREPVKGPLRLEIVDQHGVLLRSFESASEDGEKSTGGTGGPAEQGMRQPPPRPSAPRLVNDTGMHRFVWDLRVEGPRALGERSGGAGPIVAPGRYRVRLVAGEWTATQPLEVLIDPRVAAAGVTQEDLEAQYVLSLQIRDATSELRDAVARIRELRERVIEEKQQAVEGGHAAEGSALVEQARAVESRLSELENLLVQTAEGKVGAELEPQLEDQLGYLNSMLRGADQRPGRDAYLRFDDVRRELDEHLAALEALVAGELAAWNLAVAEAGVPTAFG
jgi:photosystem II stability/assembly factor-like uncharacterized protein